ncbi:hypothetical protein K438DRAFT_2021140 [Mycena galopus ATCC 62051]|nr:hypothetical protein K438DRAFT_2021140 [Mycena galopus ATCC 62051]
MPQAATVMQISLKNLSASFNLAVPLLNELSDAFGTPFLPAISNTALSLVVAVQNGKRNKEQCVHLMQSVYKVLYAIINLHMTSEPPGNLAPTSLYHLGRFTEYILSADYRVSTEIFFRTLHKIYTFAEAQDTHKIKSIFRQGEMAALLKNCHTGLQEASEAFKIAEMTIVGDIAKMRNRMESMHQELLELISTLFDETSSDGPSFGHIWANSSLNSSNSFSMLPAPPKIFHGREAELESIVQILRGALARISILGPGGIGKTSLGKAALHHPDITAKYEHRFFVASDSATTSVELAALIGAHLGLKPGKDLTKPVLQFFSSSEPSLLLLDNLETVWEPTESRVAVEEFLSLLADITHLALVITMRGAERPAKVRWTHPFLPPLKPLSDDAARQTFVDIAEDSHDSKDLTQLLSFTDNMPLAVDLMAHLVDYEGCSNEV